MSNYDLFVLIGKQAAVIESYKELLRSLECGFTSVEEIKVQTQPIEEILRDV